MNAQPDPEAALHEAGVVEISIHGSAKLEVPPRQYGRLRLLSATEIMAAPSRQYLLQGLFAPAELVVLWGQPKSGKSFLALRLAYGLALGQGIWGRAVPRPMRVLYVGAEGMGGMGARLRGLREALGDAGGHFAIIAQPVQIGPPGADAEPLLQATKAHGADFVVVDTLARTFGDGDENATRDMGAFIAKCDAMREQTGAAVLVIHHGAKGEGSKTPRGSVALMGAADVVLQVIKGADGAPSLCTIQAAKDDQDGTELPFRLEVVPVGAREDGTPVETCVAIEAIAEPGKRTAKKLRDRERQAVKILHDLIATEGAPLPRGIGFPSAQGLQAVSRRRWREECISRGLVVGEKPDSVRRQVDRAMERAIQGGGAACRDDLVWAVRAA